MRVSVDNRLILDIHGFAGIFESIQTLFIVGFCWTDTGDHVSIGIPPQTAL